MNENLESLVELIKENYEELIKRPKNQKLPTKYILIKTLKYTIAQLGG